MTLGADGAARAHTAGRARAFGGYTWNSAQRASALAGALRMRTPAPSQVGRPNQPTCTIQARYLSVTDQKRGPWTAIAPSGRRHPHTVIFEQVWELAGCK